MKRFFWLCLALVMIVSVTACGNKQDGEKSAAENGNDQIVESQNETAASTQKSNLENIVAQDLVTDTEIQQTDQGVTDQTEAGQAENSQTGSSQTDNNQTKAEEESVMKMNIQIGDNALTATLVQNSSTEALMEMLSEGPVTIEMSDYAGMEKVGPFPRSLPTNDEQISTGAGDLILYMGNSFVIYYDTNSWNFTRLGKIDNMTQQELMDVLGDGGVTAVLSLPEE